VHRETGTATSAEERGSFHRQGFLVKPDVLSPAERDEVAAALEDACGRIVAAAASVGKQEVFGGSVAFSVVDELGVRNLVWEGEGLDVVKVAEPITQVEERLARLWDHPVLVELAKMALGTDAVAPFTDKFNAKRAGAGGEFLWHQDLPFWYSIIRGDARDTVTIGVFVDEATEANGALVVVPGTQAGSLPRRLTESEVMLRYHADDAQIDTTRAIVAEVPAGGALVFGPHLLHRSGANATGRDRRVLLLTFQPAGRQRLAEFDYEPALLAEQWMDELP
jgi:ectoine hydroxylase-related dioxygenase (phytanoyl-CoA dioxygenase family)